MAFAAAHDVNAVLVSDGPQSLPLKQMLAALNVPPLKVGGVLLYQVRPETLAPYANLTSVDMEARENDIRFSELLIAAHKYLADRGDPARLTLGVAVQWGLLAAEWSAPPIQKTNYTVWLNTEQGRRIVVGLTGITKLSARSSSATAFLRKNYISRTITGWDAFRHVACATTACDDW
jgi:hypothetical protein